MNAQKLIDNADANFVSKEEFMKQFYPQLFDNQVIQSETKDSVKKDFESIPSFSFSSNSGTEKKFKMNFLRPKYAEEIVEEVLNENRRIIIK